MKRRTARLGAALLAAGLLAAGCGSDTDATDAGSSPLAEFLGQDSDVESDGLIDRFYDKERLREESIAACMKAEGFDYIPVYMSDVNFVEGLEDDSREYAEKYGFGISTLTFSQAEVGPDLVGHSQAGPTDPNQEMVEGLDDTTRDAYYEALYGSEEDFPVVDETMSEEELNAASEDFEPSGCEGKAYSENPLIGFYQEFEEQLAAIYEAVADDPRIAETKAEISDCVAEKGFETGSSSNFLEDLFELFIKDLSEVERLSGGFPVEDLTEQDFETMTEEELEAIFNKPRELTPEALTLLADMQQRETGMAVAYYDCGGNPFIGSEDIYLEVLAEYEEKFLQDNADRLEQYEADG